MATVLAALLVLFIATAQSTGLQIQETVNQTNAIVEIDIPDMITWCVRQDETFNPHISGFIFSFWAAGCWEQPPITEYPQLFNSILSAMRRCLRPCGQVFRYQLPDIPCTGQAYPDTMSVVFSCDVGWQVPLVVESTTTARPPRTTAAPTTTTATTPTTTTTPTTITTTTPPTTTLMPTTTTPTTTTPTTTTTTTPPTTTTMPTTTTTRTTTTTQRTTRNEVQTTTERTTRRTFTPRITTRDRQSSRTTDKWESTTPRTTPSTTVQPIYAILCHLLQKSLHL